jgi:hypothetical protein
MSVIEFPLQGCTALNLYTPYGGTNHGSIGDPDVFCSYDYSACIREHGFVSLRYRLARLALLQLQACSDILCNADRDTVHSLISCEPPASLFSVRACTRSNARILFIRNFQRTPEAIVVTVTLSIRHKNIVSHLEVPHRTCVTCASDVLLPASRITILLSTLPLLMRSQRGDADVIVVCAGVGSIVLEEPEDRKLQFHSDSPKHFTRTTVDGCTSLTFCAGTVVTALEPSITINVLSPQSSVVTPLKLDLSSSLAPAMQLHESLLELEWMQMPNAWAMWPWRHASGPLNDLQLDASAGHIVYRYTFSLSAEEAVTFNLSARHVLNMWINGRHVAHKVAYSNPWRLATVNQAAGLVTSILPSPLIMKAGYSCGNDNPRRGSLSVTVGSPVVHEGSNELIIVVDNLGHQRQALVHDDCRNPRGILSFSCSSSAVISNMHWSYAAQTCTTATNAMVTHGVPVDEVMQLHNAETAENWKSAKQPFRLSSDGLQWFRTHLSIPQSLLTAAKFPLPLRLSVSGVVPPNANACARVCLWMCVCNTDACFPELFKCLRLPSCPHSVCQAPHPACSGSTVGPSADSTRSLGRRRRCMYLMASGNRKTKSC